MLAEILAQEILKEDFDVNWSLLFADDPIGKKERQEAASESRVSTKRIGSGAGVQRRQRPFIQLRVRPFVGSQKFGNAPFKVLCIKNFHALDVEQQAFRRIMEQYSNNCRMILITDRVSGIIDPILSRCQIIFVPYLPTEWFRFTIKNVCDKEHVKYNEMELLDISNKMRYTCRNNLGKALDLLQLAGEKLGTITIPIIDKMHVELRQDLIKDLFIRTLSDNFRVIRKSLREIFYKKALSKTEILLELSQLIFRLSLPREIRGLYLNLIADTDFKSLDSTDDEIQLDELLSKMILIGKESKSYLNLLVEDE